MTIIIFASILALVGIISFLIGDFYISKNVKAQRKQDEYHNWELSMWEEINR